MTGPDVSIVVISFNDATRLRRAIRSVQRQTLHDIDIIVVDDASTDRTAQVVTAIAESDPRVRYERLPENSGGCSAPRNRGMDLARAPWVMFCDSDDEYERHACKNLLQAAERTGADVVCGTAERIDVRTGRTKRWRPEVHDEARVADGLVEFPELLYDTISVNKIYRADMLRRNGIRFPEGLLFEDQLFTLEAMASAGRVATIPETVYRWYVDRLSDEPSITQRRNEARNVESRIEVNRRIDRFLGERSLDRLRRVKDLKFLRHDLYLYLSSMLEVDDETGELLVDRLAPYVEGLDLSGPLDLRPGLAIAVYHLLQRDLAGVRAAMRFVRWASVVDRPIVGDGDGEFWGCSHLADGPSAAGRPARDWLDVTDLHLRRVPFTQRRFLHRIDSVTATGGRLVVHGSTVDYDGSIAASDGLELRYLIGGSRTLLSVPAHWADTDGPVRRWTAAGLPIVALRRSLADKDRGTVGLAVRSGDLVNITSARSAADDVTPVRLAFGGDRTLTGPDAVELHAYDNGAVGWRAVRTSSMRRRLVAARASWLRLRGATRLATFAALVRRDGLGALVRAVGRLLPAGHGAVFEANGGRGFGGGVRAVSDALSATDPAMRQAWVVRTDPEAVPAHARPVLRGGLQHQWRVARAGLVVTDGVSSVAAPPRALVVNAATLVPIHREGLDDPSVLVSRTGEAAVRREARGWGLLLAPSSAAGALTATAHDYRGPVEPVGIPAMDQACTALASPTARTGLRVTLDLPSDRKVLLYVPAARGLDFPSIDLEAWAAALGDRTYLLVAPPAGQELTVPTRLRFAARDLADVTRIEPYLAACELVISDYSTVVGDAALLDRPIVLFQPDRDRFVNRTRGLYPGLDAVGPIARDMGGLVVLVDRWLADPADWTEQHGPARRLWARTWCGPADGQSTTRALTAIAGARS